MHCKPSEKGSKRNAQPLWGEPARRGTWHLFPQWGLWQTDARGSNLSRRKENWRESSWQRGGVVTERLAPRSKDVSMRCPWVCRGRLGSCRLPCVLSVGHAWAQGGPRGGGQARARPLTWGTAQPWPAELPGGLTGAQHNLGPGHSYRRASEAESVLP